MMFVNRISNCYFFPALNEYQTRSVFRHTCSSIVFEKLSGSLRIDICLLVADDDWVANSINPNHSRTQFVHECHQSHTSKWIIHLELAINGRHSSSFLDSKRFPSSKSTHNGTDQPIKTEDSKTNRPKKSQNLKGTANHQNQNFFFRLVLLLVYTENHSILYPLKFCNHPQSSLYIPNVLDYSPEFNSTIDTQEKKTESDNNTQTHRRYRNTLLHFASWKKSALCASCGITNTKIIH